MTFYVHRLVETPISPKGRNYRNSGRVLRTIIQEYHLLCAAARRKRPERRPETSGDNQKLGKVHILNYLDYLKRTTEHPGKIVYLIESSVRYL